MERATMFCKTGYESPYTERTIVALEGGFCKASDVVKKDEDSGDVSIDEQGKGGDGHEFEIDF